MSGVMSQEERERFEKGLEVENGVLMHLGRRAPQLGAVAEEDACFGDMWEPIGEPLDGEPTGCDSCVFRFRCLDAFVRPEGPLAQAYMTARVDPEKPPTPEQMSQVLGINPEAVAYAMQVKGLVSAEEREDSVETDVEAEAPETQEEEMPKKKPRGAKKKKVPPKKKAGKKKAKSSSKENPTQAGSVKRAKDSASMKKTKNAKRAKAPVDRMAWGEHTYEARFQRERERNQYVRMLTPGMVLTKTYKWGRRKGETYTLKVLSKGYVLNPGGHRYPTLYTAAAAVDGMWVSPPREGKPNEQRFLSNWSGPRFWGVKEHLRQAGKI